MKAITYPLAIPDEQLNELRETAQETGFSVADVMRQSMKLGLSPFREKFSPHKLTPMTEEECRQAWEVPNPEFDALEHHCASLPQPKPADEA